MYSYPFPAVAKILAADSANATTINIFNSSMAYLPTPNNPNAIFPSRDLFVKTAFLDLSQVMRIPLDSSLLEPICC